VAKATRRIVVLRDGLIVEDTADFARAMQALHATDLAGPEQPEKPEDSITSLPMKDS